jgi:hypothetical protein
MTSGNGLTVAYASFNKPTSITRAAERVYDRRFDRWMKEDAFVIVTPDYPNFEHDHMEAVLAREQLSLLAREGLELAKANAPPRGAK